jgi:transposase InsO family protein
VARYLAKRGLVTPQPHKRPRSSYIRFQAAMPNECWQSDFTHYRLTRPDGRPGRDTEIITWLDDHSRYALSVTAHHRITGPIVLTSFRNAAAQHGHPASTLTDNGMVFTVRFAGHGRRGGRTALEVELQRLGITQKNSRPNHPTTCGKVERLHQTMKRWLRAQPPAATITELQTQLDDFADHYNHHRPHRSLPHRCTPAVAYTTRPKAAPDHQPDSEYRVRHDRVDKAGKVTLRHNSRLHHIGIGRPLAGTPIVMLIHDLNIRIIHAATGEIIRHLTLDPQRQYQPTGKPIGGPSRPYGPRKSKQPEP